MDDEGWSPKEMPRRETEHEAPRAAAVAGQATGAAAVIDTSLGLGEAPRAHRGQRVLVCVDVIKADRKADWDQLLHEVLGPAGAQVDAPLMRTVRVMEPVEADSDGTWTYLLVMDPWVEGAEYEVVPYLAKVYGAEKAREYDRLWDDCHVREQYSYEVVESAW
jgi:hypothetical protein